jgi:hypothetical protein
MSDAGSSTRGSPSRGHTISWDSNRSLHRVQSFIVAFLAPERLGAPHPGWFRVTNRVCAIIVQHRGSSKVAADRVDCGDELVYYLAVKNHTWLGNPR